MLNVILLVDDNPTNLEILVKSLSQTGYKVRVAQDGESAIAQIPYAQPDLILLDVMMPKVDGFETCRRLKANPDSQAIPVIFMTALTDTFDKVRGFEAGAVDYITKPFEIEEVLMRVRNHLAIQNLQNQLQSQNQQLQAEIQERKKAEEALQVFLQAVSHDLRNPVTGERMVLMSFLEEASAGDGHANIPAAILQRMIQGCDRQLSLINTLLETHSNDLRGISIHLQSVNLVEFIAQIATAWQPLLSKSETTIQVQLPTCLPPIYADPTQLWRVYENLIANAIKHNPPGLTLTLSATILAVEDWEEKTSQACQKQRSPYLYCTVQDDGGGISPEQAASMFELYKRGEQGRRSVGLGLGLYLCQQIISAHCGKIGVESEQGKGSTFWFTVPLCESSFSEPTANQSSADAIQ
jgi:two-component system, sensor histidine kinase and response regulator